jgi:hypothetical protein
MQKPTFAKIIKSALIDAIPVMALLTLWIWFRADDLVRLSKDLPHGILVPTTTAEATEGVDV